MVLYLAVTSAAVISGINLRSGKWRLTILGGLGTVAILLLMIQMVVGFPLHDAVLRDGATDAKQETVQDVAQSTQNGQWGTHFRFTPWFFLAYHATVVSLALVVAEWYFLHASLGMELHKREPHGD